MARHDRRRFVALTGSLIAAAPFSFTVPHARAAGAPPRRGGVLTLLVEPEPPTLLSIANTAGSTLKTSAKTNEGLLAYSFDLQPKPQLATAWQVSPDGLQYRFTLRRGVKWHDGRPFTSADVAFSIGLLKDAHPRGRGTFANVAELRTPDDWTVVVNSVNRDGNPVVADANQFNDQAPAGSHYEIVNYTVTYNGAKKGLAAEVQVAMVTSAGNVVNSYENLVMLKDGFGLDEMYKGASATGSVAFAVPDGDAAVVRVTPGLLADEVFVKP